MPGVIMSLFLTLASTSPLPQPRAWEVLFCFPDFSMGFFSSQVKCLTMLLVAQARNLRVIFCLGLCLCPHPNPVRSASEISLQTLNSPLPPLWFKATVIFYLVSAKAALRVPCPGVSSSWGHKVPAQASNDSPLHLEKGPSTEHHT